MRFLVPIVIPLVLSGCFESDGTATEAVVQIGHSGELRFAVFSEDCSRLVTVSQVSSRQERTEAILWDTQSGARLRTFTADDSREAPEFVLRGRGLICGSFVYDLQSGRLLWDLREAGKRLITRRVSADGMRVLVADEHGVVRGLNLASGTTFLRWTLADWYPQLGARATERVNGRGSPHNCVLDLEWNARNEVVGLIMETESDGQKWGRSLIGVWNLTHGRKISQCPVDIIDRATLGPQALFVVTHSWDDTGSSDEAVVVFNAHSGRRILSRRELAFADHSMPFMASGTSCWTGTASDRAILVDLGTGDEVCCFPTGGTIHEIRVLNQDRILETVNLDGTTHRWEIETRRACEVPEYPESWAPDTLASDLQRGGRRAIQGQRFSTDGRFFLGHSDHETWLCNSETGDRLAELSSTRDDQYGIHWNHDGSRAITQTDGIWTLWDVPHGRCLQTIGYQSKPGTFYGGPQCRFSPNGRFVCTYGLGATLWDARTGAPAAATRKSLQASHGERVLDAPNRLGLFRRRRSPGAFAGRSILSDDGVYCASWNTPGPQSGQTVVIRDLNRGRIIRTFVVPHGDLTFNASFSAQNRYFSISTVEPVETHVWNLETGRRVVVLPGESADGYSWRSAGSAVFLAEESQVLYISGQRTLRLVESESGRVIHELVDPTDLRPGGRDTAARSAMLLSPDERYVAVDYSTDYTLVWDLKSGEVALRIDHSTGNIPVTSRMFFSDDSKRLLESRNQVTIWNLATGMSTTADHSDWIRKGISGFPRWTVAATDGLIDASPDVVSAVAQPEGSRRPLRGGYTADGRKLIVYNPDRSISVYDAAQGRLQYRCFRFGFSTRWLTGSADGRTWSGALQHIRLRDANSNRLRAVGQQAARAGRLELERRGDFPGGFPEPVVTR